MPMTSRKVCFLHHAHLYPFACVPTEVVTETVLKPRQGLYLLSSLHLKEIHNCSILPVVQASSGSLGTHLL